MHIQALVLAIPLLKCTQHAYKDIHTWMLTEALFERAEDQSPINCPFTEVFSYHETLCSC